MPVDEQVQKVLERYAAFGVPPLVTLSPQEARQRLTIRDAVNALRQKRGEPVVPEAVRTVWDESIAGPEGEIRARLYRPDVPGRLPMLIYFHGGGWVLGNLESCDATCRALANMVGCLVISVGYRLAPEHQFPAAVQDAYVATRWARENAARLGGDATRLAVGGEDVGGNLAAVVTLMTRDSQEPTPLYQVLIYPILDDAFTTPSYEHNAYVRPLSRDEMRWFWGHYLPNPTAGANEYASPLRAEDMSDLPPGLIVTAEFDVVRDEAEAYARQLEAAGVPMAQRRQAGMVHGFLNMVPVVQAARESLEEIATWLRVAFYPPAEQMGAEVYPSGAHMPTTVESSAGQEREVARNVPLRDDSARGSASLTPSEGGPPVESPGAAEAEAAAQQPPLESGLPLRVGMEVVGSDGQMMGTIKEVRATDFVVDRQEGEGHVALPFLAIYEAGERVVLIVPANEATKIDWPHILA